MQPEEEQKQRTDSQKVQSKKAIQEPGRQRRELTLHHNPEIRLFDHVGWVAEQTSNPDMDSARIAAQEDGQNDFSTSPYPRLRGRNTKLDAVKQIAELR